MLEKLGLTKKSLLERWVDQMRGAVEDATKGLERTSERASELASSAGRKGGALLRETGERAVSGKRRALDEASELRDRAREVGGDVRDAGERLGRRARAGARAGREELAARMESIANRAAQIRAQRRCRREGASEAARRLRARRSREPMQFDVRGDDRVVLRGRRSVDVRMSDGDTIRYRYYDNPGVLKRIYFNLTGRRVWPR